MLLPVVFDPQHRLPLSAAGDRHRVMQALVRIG
jgi:hypothetical protein